MSKQESVWVQYVREHYEPASDVEMSYEDENNLLWLLNAPAGYRVEDEMLEYAQKHPDASMKELIEYFDEVAPDGLTPGDDGLDLEENRPMAKDDYFVLAYRILSYLYACFKAGEQPDMDCISADVLHIPVGYWFNIMRSLTEEGYIVGLVFPASIGSAVSVKVIDLRITQKGIEFLQENSMMKKAAAFLKTIKETVPCI